jgi:DNA-binding transcriptional regulator PaaX
MWQVSDADDAAVTDAVGADERAGVWLLLVYRVPSEPTRLRAAVWRRLKSLGAVYLQNSAAVLPAGEGAERALRRLRHEIGEMQGTAMLLSCTPVVGGQDVAALFQAARDGEYEEILDKCADFHTGLERNMQQRISPSASWRRTRSNW